VLNMLKGHLLPLLRFFCPNLAQFFVSFTVLLLFTGIFLKHHW
jgi:hypothetical protein